MKQNLKILLPTARLFLVGYFAVWSLTSFLVMQQISYDRSVQDESYLLTSQLTTTFLNGIEENRKLRNSGENDSRFYHSPNYPGITGINFVRPSGNYHSIIPEDIPAIFKICLAADHPRPPPNSI